MLPLFVIGCQCGEPPGVVSSSDPDASAPAAAANARFALPARQAPGAIAVKCDDQRVWLATKEALRLAVLERVADRCGFRLEIGRLEPHLVTERLEGVELAGALSSLLRGATYSIDFAFDAGRNTHRPRVVRAGDFGPPPAPPRGDRSQTDPLLPPSGTGGETVASWNRRTRVERAEAALNDADWRTSAESESLDERDGDDAPPEGTATHFGGVSGGGREIRSAEEELSVAMNELEAENVRVIINSIQVLEDSNDPSVLPRLRPLLDHPNPAVRERADEAIEWLE